MEDLNALSALEALHSTPSRRYLAADPMGYPAQGRWAEPKRLPVEEVVHWDRWGDTHARS